MKINIRLLSLSLFWCCPVFLDLDTGLTYNVMLHANIIEKLKNKRKLPMYSEAPIYQSYIRMAKDKFGFDAGDFFERYPHFDLIPDQKPDNLEGFFQEAAIICDSIDNPAMPEFGAYLDLFKNGFARDWCAKESYEWYE